MSFEIQTLKRFALDFSEKTKRAQDYIFILIEKGGGYINVDFFNHEVEDNIIWFITEGRGVHTQLVNHIGIVIRFDDSFLDLNRSDNRKSFGGILHHYFCHSPFFKPNEEELAQFQHLFYTKILLI